MSQAQHVQWPYTHARLPNLMCRCFCVVGSSARLNQAFHRRVRAVNMWGNHHQDARTAPRAQQPPQNGQANFAMQGLGKRPRPAGHNEEEEAMRMMNAAGSWNQMMKMRGALTAPQQQAYADGQQQVSFPINPAMMQAQQMQGQPHPAMLQKYQQMLLRQQQLQAEQAKGPGDSNFSAMPPQARPDASVGGRAWLRTCSMPFHVFKVRLAGLFGLHFLPPCSPSMDPVPRLRTDFDAPVRLGGHVLTRAAAAGRGVSEHGVGPRDAEQQPGAACLVLELRVHGQGRRLPPQRQRRRQLGRQQQRPQRALRRPAQLPQGEGEVRTGAYRPRGERLSLFDHNLGACI